MAPRFEHLHEIADPDRISDIRRRAEGIVRRSGQGSLCITKHLGWLAVPTEDSHLAVEGSRVAIAQAAAQLQQREIFAVVLEEQANVAPVRLPLTVDALEELNRRYGVWPFVAFPGDVSWGLVQTKDDLLLYLGTPRVVEVLLGRSIRESGLRYDRYIADGAWNQVALRHFDQVRHSLTKTYPALREGQCATIPTTW